MRSIIIVLLLTTVEVMFRKIIVKFGYNILPPVLKHIGDLQESEMSTLPCTRCFY